MPAGACRWYRDLMLAPVARWMLRRVARGGSVTASVNFPRGGLGLPAQHKYFSRCRRGGLTGIVDGGWAGVAARPRRITMQPFISQALLATRTAEMHREAQIARRARDLKRARRARRAPAAGAARHSAGPAFS